MAKTNTPDGEMTESAASASAAKTVRVRWSGGHNTGYRTRREINGHEWRDTGRGAQPADADLTVTEVDAAWWATLTPAQRKAEHLEEVT